MILVWLHCIYLAVIVTDVIIHIKNDTENMKSCLFVYILKANMYSGHITGANRINAYNKKSQNY